MKQLFYSLGHAGDIYGATRGEGRCCVSAQLMRSETTHFEALRDVEASGLQRCSCASSMQEVSGDQGNGVQPHNLSKFYRLTKDRKETWTRNKNNFEYHRVGPSNRPQHAKER